MKLLNRTLVYLSGVLLLLLAVWATIFYFEMLDEVYDSIDDGLDNYKTVIIQKAQTDSTVLHKTEFAESNYSIHEINAGYALQFKETYNDTQLYMQNEADYEPVRLLTTVFKLDKKYYQLQVISSMVEEDDLIEDLLYSLVWLYLALVASILFINNLLLRRIWRPFYNVLNQLRNFRLGKENKFTPPPTNIKEFKVLNETVDSFISHSTEMYNSQKQFIENASHELQTPVAISINKLELLAERTGMDEESLMIVGSVMQNLERLTRLNKSLLLLSKIENRQFSTDGPVNIQDIVTKLVSGFEDLAQYKEVTVLTDYQNELTPPMNRDLAEILTGNLVKNAILHNHTGGEVVISVYADSLIVSNTGGSTTLDESRMFGRFYKQSADNASTGLGLAIVKAIVDIYGFTVKYSHSGSRHTFIIIFS
ncbi:MAG TPA: HAMP domain-containing sensor histidine kinase [Bacteroidia bacterium]|nr:HAMP domain-containing sensor histidine kinase [Bacteroidia bacterium]